jgi:rod shape-determining protein MreD
VILFLGAVLEGSISHRIAIASVPPDFLLVGTCCVALLTGRSAGALVGFLGGLLSGALAINSVGAFVVSRTLAGFFAGWSRRLLSPTLWATCLVVTCVCSFAAELTFLLVAPQSDLAGWVQRTVTRSAYNAVLSVPVYVLLLRLNRRAPGQ